MIRRIPIYYLFVSAQLFLFLISSCSSKIDLRNRSFWDGGLLFNQEVLGVSTMPIEFLDSTYVVTLAANTYGQGTKEIVAEEGKFSVKNKRIRCDPKKKAVCSNLEEFNEYNSIRRCLIRGSEYHEVAIDTLTKGMVLKHKMMSYELKILKNESYIIIENDSNQRWISGEYDYDIIKKELYERH